MPVWLAIVIAVVGALVGVFGGIGVSAYLQERARHKAAKKNQAEDTAELVKEEQQRKLDEIEEKEFMNKVVDAVSEKLVQLLTPIIEKSLKAQLKPINDKLEKVEGDLGLVKAGVQDTCRSDLEELAAKADTQKFMSRYDKDRFEHTYKSYHALGENGVMDATRERVMKLPDAKPRRNTSK